MQYKDRLYRRNKGNTQHKGRKTQIQVADSGKKGRLHAPTSEAPSSRSDAVDPRRSQARPAKAEHGLHAQSESKDSLACEDHTPSSGETHDQYFRR
jgi:hypothetical protein